MPAGIVHLRWTVGSLGGASGVNDAATAVCVTAPIVVSQLSQSYSNVCTTIAGSDVVTPVFYPVSSLV